MDAGTLSSLPPKVLAAYLRDPRQQLFSQMIEQGTDASPVQSPWQGLARMVKAGMGAWQGGKLEDQFKQQEQDQADERRNAIAVAVGRPAETEKLQSGGEIKWNAQAPNYASAAGMLGSGNQDLQEKLLKMASPDGSVPATIQIANAMQQAKVSGDMERFNLLNLAHKTMDRGVSIDPNTGGAVPLAGYGEALGSIAATKAGMSQQAEKTVDARMNPLIAGREAAARLEQQLAFEPSIKQATDIAAGSAKRLNEMEKKTIDSAQTTEMIDRAEQILPKASGGLAGKLLSAGKSIINHSDETTQANRELELLSGWLTSNVPRMEGPQSNYDIEVYKKMAANVGDINIPVGDRVASARLLRSLQEKYARPRSTQSLDNLPNPPTPQQIEGTMRQGPQLQGDAANKLRNAGYSEEQITEYFRSRGLQ